MKRDDTLIKKFLPCALWDFAGLQAWLNQQAQAGYALERWPKWTFLGLVHFRADPQAVHARYCLDPLRERIGDTQLRDQAASYREFGWYYVESIGNLYAVYRCDDPEAQDLYTDPCSLAYALKKQVRWAWLSMLFWIAWTIYLFRSELVLLIRRPAEFGMKLILQSDLMLPLYGFMLVFLVTAFSSQIGALRGIRRIRTALRRGEWPGSGTRRFPECVRAFVTIAAIVLLALYLIVAALSGALRPRILSGPEEWDFPHVTLEEVLPAGASLRAYDSRELLHSDTFDHSLLAPEQYDVAQGGKVTREDGTVTETRLYQEHVRTLSPALAQAVYRGRVTAHRHVLEEYRINWEANTSTLHSNLPNAFDSMAEESLSYPGLDGLTRFTYQFSDARHPNVVYIGLAGERVFVLNCSGAADSQEALSLLVQRLDQA